MANTVLDTLDLGDLYRRKACLLKQLELVENEIDKRKSIADPIPKVNLDTESKLNKFSNSNLDSESESDLESHLDTELKMKKPIMIKKLKIRVKPDIKMNREIMTINDNTDTVMEMIPDIRKSIKLRIKDDISKMEFGEDDKKCNINVNSKKMVIRIKKI